LLEGTRTDSTSPARELERGRYLIARHRDDSRIIACARIAPADDADRLV
jgi:hypothetical protein